MHVIQMLDKYCFGGGERVAITYNQTVKDLGHKANILAIKDKRTSHDASVVLAQGYVEYLSFIYSSVNKNKDDKTWLICHSMRSLFVALAFKAIYWKRLNVCFVQHLFYSEMKLRLISFSKLFLNKLVQITPVTQSVVSKHFSESKLFYLNNYIHQETYVDSVVENSVLKEFIAMKNDRIVISFVGAVKKGKNAAHIVELAKRLPSSEYVILIVGAGIELPEIKEQVISGAIGNVFFAGYQEQPLQFLAVSHYLFFPSYHVCEMMPMAVLEAKANECIVFGYDLAVNMHLLPSKNIFSYQQFDLMASAILTKSLEYSANKFNAQYGEEKFVQLLGSK